MKDKDGIYMDTTSGSAASATVPVTSTRNDGSCRVQFKTYFSSAHPQLRLELEMLSGPGHATGTQMWTRTGGETRPAWTEVFALHRP